MLAIVGNPSNSPGTWALSCPGQHKENVIMQQLVAGLPKSFPAAMFVVLHLAPQRAGRSRGKRAMDGHEGIGRGRFTGPSAGEKKKKKKKNHAGQKEHTKS